MENVIDYEKTKPKKEPMRKGIYKLESPSGCLQARHTTSRRNLRMIKKRKAGLDLNAPLIEGHDDTKTKKKKIRKKKAIKFKKELQEKLIAELEQEEFIEDNE